MSARTYLTIAVGALLLFGLVVAVGAATPAEHGNDAEAEISSNSSDAVPDDPWNVTSVDENETTDDAVGTVDENSSLPDEAETPDRLGPSDGIPGQAHDRVSEIHASILGVIGDSPWLVGDLLSDLLGEEAAADQAAGGQAEGPSGNDLTDDAPVEDELATNAPVADELVDALPVNGGQSHGPIDTAQSQPPADTVPEESGALI